MCACMYVFNQTKRENGKRCEAHAYNHSACVDKAFCTTRNTVSAMTLAILRTRISVIVFHRCCGAGQDTVTWRSKATWQRKARATWLQAKQTDMARRSRRPGHAFHTATWQGRRHDKAQETQNKTERKRCFKFQI